jgi:ribosome-associated protein
MDLRRSESMIRVSDDIALPNREVKERFVRSYGSGGRNPRKEATAVVLRFDIGASSLPPDVKDRLLALAGRHVTSNGVLMLVSRASRSQARNRATAHARLVALLRRAARMPKERRPTSLERETRLASKRRRSAAAASRKRTPAR